MLPIAVGSLLWLAVVAEAPFAIHVVDEATGHGVPLVELKTTAQVTCVTDSAGLVAFDEPGLLGNDVWFTVRSHGYEYPADGFGFRGVRLRITPGGHATLRIRRINIAERVCRLSGSGIYRDSVLAGRVPAADALLHRAHIAGYDSVQAARYRGKMYWFWGDTTGSQYPLGNFHMTGATSPLPSTLATDSAPIPDPFVLKAVAPTPANGDSAPTVVRGIPYDYFTDDSGFARGVCRMAGPGPTWMDGLTVLGRDDGREELWAAYAKIEPPLTVIRRGLCRWNDERNEFEHVRDLPLDAPLLPYGHPQIIDEDGQSYVVFGDPFPTARVRATPDNFTNLDRYEGFTPLVAGSQSEDLKIDRPSDGRANYAWKADTPALAPAEEADAVRRGVLRTTEAHWHLVDAQSGKFVEAHRGSVRWNAYRQRWVLIATQIGGTSQLGEVWYAEADACTGPWGAAVKIVTHDDYSFYNPLHHPKFDVAGGRVIHFEGTYTRAFSGNPVATPRYDYNQILYRLDLAAPGLKAAQQAAAPSPAR